MNTIRPATDGKGAAVAQASAQADRVANSAVIDGLDVSLLQLRDAYLIDLTRLDTHISDEYQWTGQRISWLLVTNSFLLLSFISASSFLVNPEAEPYARLSVVYMLGVPIVGIGSSLLVFVGVIAAQSMVKKVKLARDDVQRKFEVIPFFYVLPPMGTATGSWPNRCGKAAGIWMPILLVLLWAAIVLALLWSSTFWIPVRRIF